MIGWHARRALRPDRLPWTRARTRKRRKRTPASPSGASSILQKTSHAKRRGTLIPELGVSPNSLPATLGDSATAGTGDMVLVRIKWNREALSFAGDGHEADDSEDTEDDAAEIETVPMVAIGLARCELELCGQSTI